MLKEIAKMIGIASFMVVFSIGGGLIMGSCCNTHEQHEQLQKSDGYKITLYDNQGAVIKTYTAPIVYYSESVFSFRDEKTGRSIYISGTVTAEPILLKAEKQ